MTEKYTPEKVAELAAEARAWASLIGAEPRGARDVFSRLADALSAVSAERDAEHERAESGWKTARAANRAAVKAMDERDRLHKAITEALDEFERLEEACVAVPSKKFFLRILRAALDKEGNDDDQRNIR